MCPVLRGTISRGILLLVLRHDSRHDSGSLSLLVVCVRSDCRGGVRLRRKRCRLVLLIRLFVHGCIFLLIAEQALYFSLLGNICVIILRRSWRGMFLNVRVGGVRHRVRVLLLRGCVQVGDSECHVLRELCKCATADV